VPPPSSHTHTHHRYKHYRWDAITELAYAGAVNVYNNGTVGLTCTTYNPDERDAEFTILQQLTKTHGVRLTQSIGAGSVELSTDAGMAAFLGSPAAAVAIDGLVAVLPVQGLDGFILDFEGGCVSFYPPPPVTPQLLCLASTGTSCCSSLG
jgi:hypothetical protein